MTTARQQFLALSITAVAITAALALLGVWLDWRHEFLNDEGAYYSARAMLAAMQPTGSPKSLILVSPPLPHYLTIGFAALHLPHPAIWSASFMAAMTAVFLARLLPGKPFLNGWLGLAVCLVLLQPGLILGAVHGSPDVMFAMTVTAATVAMARYILEREKLDHYSRSGKMIHTMRKHAVMDLHLSDLWAAAFWLALAAMAWPTFGIFTLLYLPVIPFLLSREERTDVRRSVTLALLLLLPIATAMGIWSYMGWIFDDDFTTIFSHPEFSFSRTAAGTVLTEPALSRVGSLSQSTLAVASGMLACAVALPWVLWRIRSIGVGLLIIPIIAAAIAARFYGIAADAWSDILPFTMMTFGLAFLAIHTRRIREKSIPGLVFALVLMTVVSWAAFAFAPDPNERIFHRLATGDSIASHQNERNLLKFLETSEQDPVLLDDTSGYVLVALSGRKRDFITPHHRLFYQALANFPKLGYPVCFYSSPDSWYSRDLVADHYLEALGDDPGEFATRTVSGSWVFGTAIRDPHREIPTNPPR